MTATAERFYVTGGTLQYNAPSYVVRKADTDLLEGLRQGEFCYILNARQMGKSSLMTRAAVRLREDGFSVAVLDLTEFGSNLTIEQWYYGMLRSLGEQIGLFDELVDFWRANKEIGPLNRFFAALRQVALPALPGSRKDAKAQREEDRADPKNAGALLAAPSSLVIFVDEIDYVRSMPFSTDEFFAGIRECYNHRAQDPLFFRLAFCLIGVATPADLIRDTRATPFNIGRRIELRDFTTQEAAPLAEGLVHHPPVARDTEARREEDRSPAIVVSEGHVAVGSTAKEFIPSPLSKVESRKLLDRILYWTGGHPYLTQRLCRAVSQLSLTPATGEIENRKSKIENPTIADVDRLCQDLYLSRKARETDDNLAFVRNRLLRNEADTSSLLDLYARVRNRRGGVRQEEANPLVDILLLAGVVRSEEGVLRVRNRIYGEVFNREWILSNMPDAELQRQRRAYRMGLLRAGAISGVLLAIMSSLTVWAITSAQTAKHERQNALIEKGNAQDQRNNAQRAAITAQNAEKQAKNEKYAAQQATIDKGKALQKAEQEKNKALLARQEETKAKNRANEALQAKTQALQAKQVALSNEMKATASEKVARARDERLLYPSNIARAQKAIDQGDPSKARLILNEVHQASSRKKSVGFEWHYLHELCQPGAVQNLTAHHNFIGAVAYSPDGTLLASGDFDSRVLLWDVGADGKARLRPGFDFLAGQEVHSLVLTPDKQTLIVGGPGGVVFVNTATGVRINNAITQERQPDGQSKNVNALALSPDGTLLAIGRRSRLDTHPEGIVEVWDRVQDKKIAVFEHKDLLGNQPNVHAIAFSPDGRLLASGGVQTVDSKGKYLLLTRLWDVTTAKEVAVLTDPQAQGGRPWVNSLAFSPDSRFLATGNGDRTVRLWDTQRILTKTPDASASGHRVFTKSDVTLGGHNEEIWALAFSHDGKRLASGDNDNLIKVWDFSGMLASEPAQRRPPAELTTLRGHEKYIRSLAFSPDNIHLASGSGDATVKVWDLPRQILPTLYAHSDHRGGEFLSLAYSSDGRFLASSSIEYGPPNRSEVRVFDARTRQEIACVLASFPGKVYLAFAPDSRTLAVGTEHQDPKLRRLFLWDVVSKRQIWEFEEMKDPITALAFSPTGHLLATAHGHYQSQPFTYHVRLWDTQQHKELTAKDNPALAGFGRYFWDMYSLAFSSDGKILVAGGSGGDMWWWDMTTYRRIPFANLSNNKAKDADKQLQTMLYRPVPEREHQENIQKIAFSPDGKWMATGSQDKSVRLWELGTRKVRFTLREHNSIIAALAFSPERQQTLTLATSGYDNVTRLWPLVSAEDDLVQDAVTLRESKGAAGAVAFSPDGTTLATGHYGNGVILLRQTQKKQQAATPIAQRFPAQKERSTGEFQ